MTPRATLLAGTAALCLSVAACTGSTEVQSPDTSPTASGTVSAPGGQESPTVSAPPAETLQTRTQGASTTAEEEPTPVPSPTQPPVQSPARAPTPVPGTGGASTPQPVPQDTVPPFTEEGGKSALEMTPGEAVDAVMNGWITMAEYCSRDSFLTSGDTQMCHYFNHPESFVPPRGEGTWRDSPTRYRFTYYEAYTAWQDGMPYYEAFCLNYVPVTQEGESQCEGIETGTVDSFTGEYIGP